MADSDEGDPRFPPGTSLHSLLQRLGSGLEDFIPHAGGLRSRMKTLLAGIKSSDSGQQTECLTELCEMLSLGSEEAVRSLNVEQFAPALVALLQTDNPSIMLLAARVLTHLMDLNAASIPVVVQSGAAPYLCAHLSSIEYIDVAEQSLQALQKISIDHGEALLNENGLACVLMFIDFFDMTVQRTAIATAANMCRNPPLSSAESVASVIPNIVGLMQHGDLQIVESSCLCLFRAILLLVRSSHSSSLLCLGENGAIQQLVALIRGDKGAPSIGPTTFTNIIKSLALLSRLSPALGRELLSRGVIQIATDALAHEIGTPNPSAVISSTGLSPAQQSTDQLESILQLVIELVPPLPRTIDILNALSAACPKDSVGSFVVDELFGNGTAMDGGGGGVRALTEEQLVDLCTHTFPILLQIAVTTVNVSVRLRTLAIISKLITHSDSSILEKILKHIPLAAHLAAFLSSRHTETVAVAVVLVGIIMAKLQTIYFPVLAREGVWHELEQLSAPSGHKRSHDMTGDESDDPLFDAPTDRVGSQLPSQLRDLVKVMTESFIPGGAEAACTAAGSTAIPRAQRLIGIFQSILGGGSGEEEEPFETFARLFEDTTETLSAFQMVRTGLLKEFIRFLAAPNISGGGKWGPQLARVKGFIHRFGLHSHLAVKEGAADAMVIDFETGNPTVVPDGSAALGVFVGKLQEILSIREQFAVLSASDPNATSLNAGLRALTQPFKLRLARAEGEEKLLDYSTNVVLIEPLATIAAIEDFLWQKVQSPELKIEEEALAAAQAAAMLSSSPPKRAGLAQSPTLSPSDEPPPMVELDEEMEDDDGDEEDEMDLEGEDVEIPRRVSSNQAPTPAAGASTSTMLERTSSSTQDRDARPSHKLYFSIGDGQITHEKSIFQAIGGLAAAAAVDSRVGGAAGGNGVSRLWESVHTIYYRRMTAADEARIERLSSEKLSPPLFSTLNLIFDEVLRTDLPPPPLDASETCLDSLIALRIIDTLNQNWSLLFSPEDAGAKKGTLLSNEDFVNQKITRKLMRQLQDPLTLCSGALPPWCTSLTSSCKFLFPFESRSYFLRCTRFGVSRALHAMQERTSDGTSRAPEIRIGRIQRQKVRVSRVKILESAIRALELYGHQKSMLEVEYFGEVGTGLGPTLEFFTLVSQQLRRKDLCMWRNFLPVDSLASESTPAPDASPASGTAAVGVFASAEKATVHEFHRVAILRCPSCRQLSAPHCAEHAQMLTRQVSDVEARCGSCDFTVGEGICSACSATVELLWWVISDDEAEYLSRAFPSGYEKLPHVALQCEECGSVNFPGTENSLVLEREGRMTSLSGKLMREQDYRGVTRHVSNICRDAPLTQIPVLIPITDAKIITKYISTTPEVEEFLGTADPAHQDFCVSPMGLFPSPIPLATSQKFSAKRANLLRHFRFLGLFIGKALLDGRLLDLPLSLPMYKYISGQPFSNSDLDFIDSELASNLRKFQALADKYEKAKASGGDLDPNNFKIDGCVVSDLSIDFTLPGSPEIELMPGGSEVNVTIENLGDYTRTVFSYIFSTGIQDQLDHFSNGLSQVVPMMSLRLFSPEELEILIRGQTEKWEMSTLEGNVKCDHGYNGQSKVIRWLFELLSSFSHDDRRLFLRFATGSPALPPAGLKGLRPKLTVVRRDADCASTPDQILPSVMTCANYLKLPEYSSPEILKDRLFTAMREGQLSFHLS